MKKKNCEEKTRKIKWRKKKESNEKKKRKNKERKKRREKKDITINSHPLTPAGTHFNYMQILNLIVDFEVLDSIVNWQNVFQNCDLPLP